MTGGVTGDSADLSLQFKGAGQSSGLKLKVFVVLGDGSPAFSKGFSRVIDQRCLVMSKLPLVKGGKPLQSQSILCFNLLHFTVLEAAPSPCS